MIPPILFGNISKKETVPQNAPGLAQYNDPGKPFRGHSGQAGEVTQKVIGSQRQQNSQKKYHGVASTAVEPSHKGVILFQRDHAPDQAASYVPGQEKGDERAGADADVVAPEAAHGPKHTGPDDTAQKSGKHWQDHLDGLNYCQDHRRQQTKASDVGTEGFNRLKVPVQVTTEQKQPGQNQQNDQKCGEQALKGKGVCHTSFRPPYLRITILSQGGVMAQV